MNTMFFKKIEEYNKSSLNKPVGSDMIYFSELNEWYTNNAFRSFSIKFVIDQTINYKIDGSEIAINANQYMVACPNSDVKAYFNKKEKVRSICIDICPQTLADTFTILTTKNVDLENVLAGYLRYPEFYESIHSVISNSIGNKLINLHSLIQKGDEQNISKDWFLDLSERLVYQEYGNYLHLNQLQSVRYSTRKEIFRRLQLADEFIASNYLVINETKEIAAHCNMSEYHFYRCFKQVFNKTPMQCLLEKKMQHAKHLIVKEGKMISEVAIMCNYPDIFSFSKAFKKFFGITPSAAKAAHSNIKKRW